MIGSYVHGSATTVWSGVLVALLEALGFSRGASRAALFRLVRRDLLRPIRRGRTVHYEVTSRLARVLDEGDRRIFSFARDDSEPGCWTFVWHAIPDDMRAERGLLASRLRFFGFGSIQQGTWVVPRDWEAEAVRLVHELKLARHAAVFAARPSPEMDLSPVIARAWDLQRLAARYRSFVGEFERYTHVGARTKLSDREACLIRLRVAHLFRGFVTLDPEFPDRLTPGAAWRRRAVSTFDVLYAELEPPGMRHFRELSR